MSKKTILDRRTFLRGMGTLIALPTLEAMIPSSALAQSAAPKRLMLVYRPMGCYAPNGAQPTDAFARLQTADVKSLVNIVSRVHHNLGLTLDNINVNGTEVGQGEHGSGVASLFSAQLPGYNSSTIVNQKVWQMKTTFDQVLAAQYGLNSIAASVSPSSTIHPRWLERYINTMSWKGPDTSLNPYSNPAEIFRLLFSGGTTQPNAEVARLQKQKSILDFVMADIATFNGILGASDKARVDQYLTSIRELEVRIDKLIAGSGGTGGQCSTTGLSAPEMTSLKQAEYPLRLGIMQDLAVKAFQCNKAQIFNIMLAGDGDSVNYASFLSGVSGDGNWHSISHYSEDSANPAKFKTAVNWQYDQFKALLLKLNAVQDVDGASLLYNSAVVLCSSIADGQTHNFYDNHCVVAGNLGGKLKTGQLIEFQAGNKNPPIGNVWLTLMRAFGMTDSSFGNSTGVITQMLA